MKQKVTQFLLMVSFGITTSIGISYADTPVEMKDPLSRYVKLGLENNLALKQQEFSLERSLQALKEARGMFLASITIEGRYSRAGGGRLIEMPIGDLVNPIHHTLNQLLIANGLQPGFPANIANEQIPFLRETEQETKLRIVQPVFQPGIYFNQKIKRELMVMEQEKLNVFKRQLVADIEVAYYNYLKTLKVIELLKETQELLEENLHLNQSLFNNHKQTEEVVFRAQAELSQLQQQQHEADKNCRLAASYLNFLVNRPLETAIDLPQENSELQSEDYDLEVLCNHALAQRSEFRQLQGAIDAAGHSAGLHKATILPTVNAVFDYGFQGEKYRFRGEDDYWMGSLVFSWNLFRGGQDRARQKQAQLQKKELETQYQALINQIKLQVKEAFYDLQVAKQGVISSRYLLNSHKEAFMIVSKKYRQGMVPQIEYLKARSDYTNAGIGEILAIYDYYCKNAALERVAGLYNF